MISNFKSYIQPQRIALYLNTLDHQLIRLKTGDKVQIGDDLTLLKDNPSYSTVSGIITNIQTLITPHGQEDTVAIIENDYRNTLSKELKKLDIKTLLTRYFKKILPLERFDFINHQNLVINMVHFNEPFISVDIKHIEEEFEKISEVLETLHQHWPFKMVHILLTEDMDEKVFSQLQLPHNIIRVNPTKHVDYLTKNINRVFNLALIYQKNYQYLCFESLLNIHEIITHKRPTTLTRITIGGNAITQSTIINVRTGAMMQEIKRVLQGYTTKETMTIHINQLLDNKTLIHDDFAITRDIIGLYIQEYVELEMYECIGCGRCNKHCPVGILPSKIMHSMADGIALNHMRSDLCIECGLCSYYCPSKINVMEFITRAKKELVVKS